MDQAHLQRSLYLQLSVFYYLPTKQRAKSMQWNRALCKRNIKRLFNRVYTHRQKFVPGKM